MNSCSIALGGSTSLNRGQNNPLFASKRYGTSQASSSPLGEGGANGPSIMSSASALVSSASNLSLVGVAGAQLTGSQSELNSSGRDPGVAQASLPQAPPPPLPNRGYQQVRASPLVGDSTPTSLQPSAASAGGTSRPSPPASAASGATVMPSASLARGTAPPGGPKNTKV